MARSPLNSKWDGLRQRELTIAVEVHQHIVGRHGKYWGTLDDI